MYSLASVFTCLSVCVFSTSGSSENNNSNELVESRPLCVWENSKATDITEPSVTEITWANITMADVPCGKQWFRASRIVGGEAANPGEFPWLVSVTRGGGHWCGGTLVNKRWVVTAAHCMFSGKIALPVAQISVSVGAHDIKKAEAITVKVEKVINHPQYGRSNFAHDVSLLHLAHDVKWSEAVWPACLPLPTAPSFSAHQATTAGWGWMHESSSVAGRADVLQKVKLMVVDNDLCRNWYKSQGKKIKILDTQICAGFETGGRDSCYADSGGPLMVGNGDRLMVVGVVSAGIGCARPRLPGLYTRMSDYVTWIQEHVTPPAEKAL